RRLVILGDPGRMALRAHEIPVLVQLGPMQDVVVLDLFVRVEMKPALAALLLGTRVPGDGERLQPPVGKLDQILPQWIDPERVFDLESRELAVRPVGLHQELAVLPEEARVNSVIIEAGVVEIPSTDFSVACAIARLCW